jgi:hypothetical protein
MLSKLLSSLDLCFRKRQPIKDLAFLGFEPVFERRAQNVSSSGQQQGIRSSTRGPKRLALETALPICWSCCGRPINRARGLPSQHRYRANTGIAEVRKTDPQTTTPPRPAQPA